jgi:Ca-activated chloride channel family protein
LVVYALDAFVVSPLTQDNNTIVSMISSLSTDIMPGQGSRPALAVEKATQLLQQAGSADGNVLLVTDGLGGDAAREILETLQGKGHRLSVLAVGTEEGAPIKYPQGGFVKDATGAIVVPKLNEMELRDLAAQGGGRYARLVASDNDIDYLMSGFKSPLQEQITADAKRLEVEADQWREEGPWLLILVAPLAALAFRKGWLAVVALAIILPMPQTGHAFSWEDLWKNQDQRAAEAFDEGDPEKAAQLFDNEKWRAASHYKAKNYEKALELLQNDHSADGWYNKGNALARMGQVQQAIAAYEQALKIAPEHEDAAYNKKLLEKLLKQQQNQNKDSQSQDNQQQTASQQQSGKQSDSEAKSGQQQQQSDSQPQDAQSSQSQQANAGQSQEQAGQMGAQNGQAGDNAQGMRQQNDETAQDEQQQQQAMAAQRKDQADQQQKDEGRQAMMQGMNREQSETAQANEQWLRRIPDDPGGLLRRKFRYQSQLRSKRARGGEKPW